MTCPSCSAVSPGGSAECPGCGIIFAKWKARQESAPYASPVAAPVATPSNGPPLVPIFIVVLLAGGGWAYSKYKSAATGASARVETGKAGGVNPEPFKAEIMALEAVLAAPGSPGVNPAEKAAQDLEMKIFANPLLRGNSKAEDISLALSMAGAEPSLGGGMQASESLRRWENARDGFFKRADWFVNRQSAAPGQVVNVDAAVGALKKCLGDASQLLQAAETETAEYGDRDINLLSTDPEAKAQVERWRLWAQAWQARVQAAASCLPEPAATPVSLTESRRFVTQILGAIASVPNPGAGTFVSVAQINDMYVPGKSLRSNWINNTRVWVGQCSAQIDSAAKR